MTTQTSTIQNPTAKWYIDLSMRFNDLMQRNGMPEEIAAEIKLFVVDVAKEQYKAGNRSGIAWMRKQMAVDTK